MSEGAVPANPYADSDLMSISKSQTTTDKIEEKRETLEELSQTDLPAARLCQALLEVTEG